MLLMIRLVQTNSLFGVSRSVAPSCSQKPAVSVPEKAQVNNTISHTYFGPISTNSPGSGVAHPAGLHPNRSGPVSLRDHDESSDPDDDEFPDDDLSDDVVDSLAQMEGIWLHTLHSAEDAVPPPVCTCHSLAKGSCPEFKWNFVQNIVQCRQVPGPNMDGARVPLLCPSFPAETRESAMASYFDAKELVTAIKYGWDINFCEHPFPKDAQRNNGSAMQYPTHVLHYVDKELSFGSLVGPFRPDELPFRIFRSPFGFVDKVGSEWRRTVTDCSQLISGINAFIDPSTHRSVPWKLKLPNTMAIINEILRVRSRFPGQRVFIWKVDMARWYRWIFLDPSVVPFFAVQWDGKVYLDAALSFGNRGAALAAQRFIWAIIWIYRTRIPPHQGSFNSGLACACPSHCDCGSNSALAYIDDTLGFSAECLAEGNFSSYLALAELLGLRLSTTPGHISPPATTCICLGLLYDTEANTVSLPQAKVLALSALLRDRLVKPKATEKELASLAGKLLNACNVFFAGRIFLNRVLATKRRAARLSHKTVYVDQDFRDDLQWWLDAIDLRNGVSFLVHDATTEITLDASTNGWAGGLPGIGAYHFGRNEYITVCPPAHLHSLHINDLELLAHVLVARVWGPQSRRLHIKVHTDNQSCFYLVKNGRSSFDNRLRLGRIFAMSQIEHDYRVEPAWISTEDNWLADALTRSGSEKHRRIFTNFCNGLGVTPVQRHISPDMFDY